MKVDKEFLLAPYLAILERRRDLLPENPLSVGEEVKEHAVEHLRSILFKGAKPSPVTPTVFFIESNYVAFSPSRKVWEKFSLYYADLSLPLFKEGNPLLRKYFYVSPVMKISEFLSAERPYSGLKLYHVEVEGGRVFLGERAPLFGASLMYSAILRWIEEKVRPIVLSGSLDELKPYAQKALTPPMKRRRKKYAYIQKIISAVGLPDGRKRILFYWLIPYWVTVEGKTPEEVLDLANEWISRQSGGKIYSSWILAEAENVRSKGIKPWSLEKVERVDPELVKMLRGMGIL